jgi:preprotein translocase subunit SecD
MEQRMKTLGLIAAILLVAGGLGSATAAAGDIAVSLVNPSGRIDIPVSAITHVQALATIAIRNTETKKVVEYPEPHVEVCFTEDVRQQICQLTRQIVEQPLDIVIDCETVTKPIVREPLCSQPCFSISASDLEEATALAQRIRKGTDRACAPSS